MLRAFRSDVVQPVEPDSQTQKERYRAYKQLGLFLLCTAWVALGLVGRGPWKTEDAIAFATAWEMLQRSDWLVPRLAQELALTQAPLVPWLAAAGVALFAPMLDAPDAGRLGLGLLLAARNMAARAVASALVIRALQWGDWPPPCKSPPAKG